MKFSTYTWQQSRLGVTGREHSHHVAGLCMVASQHAMLNIVDRVVLPSNVVEEWFLFYAAFHER